MLHLHLCLSSQYKVTLNCLHLAFLHCPPAEQNLNFMQYRIGSEQIRTFLHDTCYVAPEDMTPKPSTTTTTQATTTTTTVRTTITTPVQSTASDLLALIQTSVQGSDQSSKTVSTSLPESPISPKTTTGLTKKQQRAHDAKLRTMEGLRPQSVSHDSAYDAEDAREKAYIQFEIEHPQEDSSERQTKAESLRDTNCSNLEIREGIKCQGITDSSHRGSTLSMVLLLFAIVTLFVNLH